LGILKNEIVVGILRI